MQPQMAFSAEPNDFQWLKIIRVMHFGIRRTTTLAVTSIYFPTLQINVRIAAAVHFETLDFGEWNNSTSVPHLLCSAWKTIPGVK